LAQESEGSEKHKGKTVDPAALVMLEEAEKANMETYWDRMDAMSPQCGFGDSGLCCRLCLQGPCRIDPFGRGPKEGICGAKDYTIVARKILRMIGGGAAAHSDHGRHLAHTLHALAEGHAPDYSIKDEEKLKRVAKKVGIETEGKDINTIAKEVAEAALGDFSRQGDDPAEWLSVMLPEKRMNLLDSHDVMCTNIDRGIAELMHRSHQGCDADPVPLIFGGIKCALGDLTGENISTDLSDVLFGTPDIVESEANLGSLKEDHINICVHGHNPVLSEVVCDAAEELKSEAEAAGAKGINIVGICCTANELLMRRGVPICTNFACSELAILTGVLDAIVVDYQCISPSLGYWSQCFHTRLISTMPITRIPTDTHIEFTEANAGEAAKEIIRAAIDAYRQRDPSKVNIPDIKSKVTAGFSLETFKRVLGNFNADDPLQYLADKIKDGTVAGVCLIAGCNNVRTVHDEGHLTIARELAKNNVLVVSTGCAAQALAKHGYLTQEATNEYAGESLKGFLTELGDKAGLGGPLPLVLHMGSCVDNSRVENLASELAQKLGVDMHQLPIVGSAPEAMSEKAVAIGTWLVATGWPTHVGVNAFHKGSDIVTEIAEVTAQDVYGGFFVFEKDPEEAARKLNNIVKYRRWRMGIGDDPDSIYWDGTTPADERPQITQQQLCKKAVDGAIIATGYADYLLNRAIRKYGRNQEIEYPDTGYYLPCIMAWTGKKVKTLGELPIILGDARRKIIEDNYTFENAVASGEATMIAAEIVEGVKYIKGEADPYGDHPYYSGFVSDVVLRELGIAFVDDTIPGAIVLVGKAKDPAALKKIIRDAQNKGMLIIPTFDIIQQIREQGIEIGEKKGLDRMMFCIGEFTQAIHGLNFAIRAAMVFGGIKPGDREGIYTYLAKRPKVVVIQLGPIDDVKTAAEFAVLFNGSPTITDQDIEEIPGKYVMQKDYTQMISTAIEVRDMEIKMGEIDIPVAYGPAFEGETVRRPQTYVEAGGAAKTLAMELCRMRGADDITDNKIELIGKDVDEIEEGGKTTLGIFVEVYGKKMIEDFESVLERRIHQFVNFAEGAWHTGQRNLVWIRLSKNGVANGLTFKDFGKILYNRMHQEFGAIVNKVQITIITDEDELQKRIPEALEIYEKRDQKLAGMTDEAVDTFYTCTLCQSFAPQHVCIISPERLGLCGAINWMDAKAAHQLSPTGPNQPVPKGNTLDENKGQWDGVNQAVKDYSHGKLDIFNQYDLMEWPMTSCGCFECIVAVTPDMQGVIVVNREHPGITPLGMKFSTLAGSVGGGLQTPGFIGVGRKFLLSKKFILANGGFHRIMWIPKELKAAMAEHLKKRCEELGTPDFFDKIATEEDATTPEELMEFCTKVGHPGLSMPPLM
jgi:carbon-monoxide dehydrogenase catalytic subunit/CO dehydrogenase/CO-methylating acetyl-CoA synthase complex beta subunit